METNNELRYDEEGIQRILRAKATKKFQSLGVLIATANKDSTAFTF